jgi:ABC-type phosphate/phosphonate transport system substrate-binding protein
MSFASLRACGGSLIVSAMTCMVGAGAEPDASVKSNATARLTIVVMDPLAAPLSCPCVKGYAQRDYDKLGASLEKKLGRRVKVLYSESLAASLKGEAKGKVDLVIGKQSVVLYDAQRSKLKVTKIGMLTGKDGTTTQTGLIVVPTDDPAKSVADLKDHRLVFGPAECAEKHEAAIELLKKHGIAPPETPETAVACDEGARLILDIAPKTRGAAVISSYAKPLLEGCGTIQKGELRVIGETEPVPFVAAFTTEQSSESAPGQIRDALFAATADPTLRIALETKYGFVEAEPKATDTVKKN